MAETEIQDFLSLFPSNLMQLSPAEQSVSMVLYQLLINGKPVSTRDIANKTGLIELEIDKILNRWGSEVLRNDNTDIIGFFGLSLSKTAHILEVEGRKLYTWCAWDTMFIPALIDKTVKVVSTCPVTKQEINLTISSSGVLSINPERTVVSLIAPDTEKITEDLVGTFCCHIHFFASPEAGNQWVQKNPGTYIVSLDHAYHLGKRKNQKRYPNVFTST